MQRKDKPLTDEELDMILQSRQAPQTSDLLAARIINQTADMPQEQPVFALNGFHAFMRRPAVAMAFAASLVIMLGYSLVTPTTDMSGWDATPQQEAQIAVQSGTEDENPYEDFAMMYDMQLSTVMVEDMN